MKMIKLSSRQGYSVPSLAVFVSLMSVFLVFLSVYLTVPPQKGEIKNSTRNNYSIDTFYELTNNHRRKIGLNELETEHQLSCMLAEIRVEQIQSDWSHDQFIPTIDRLQMEGKLDYMHIGENLGKDYPTDFAMFRAWLNSPLHRENIEREVFTKQCIRCDGAYCVHVFYK